MRVKVTTRWMMALVLALGAAHDAWAGSNLGAGGYPSHQCGKGPTQPIRPENFKSESELETYNEAVDAYNTGTEQFFQCIQLYVNNAAEDIQLIKRTISATIEEANN